MEAGDLASIIPPTMSQKTKKVSDRVGVHPRTSGFALPWFEFALGFAVATATVLLTISGLRAAVIGSIISFGLVKWMGSMQSNPIRVKDYEQDVVYLFVPSQHTDAISQFQSQRIQNLLILKSVKHQVVRTNIPGPRGDFPFVELNGETVSYPEFIIRHLNLPEEESFTERGEVTKNMMELFLKDTLHFLEWYTWYDPRSFTEACSFHFGLFPAKISHALGHMMRFVSHIALARTGLPKLTRKELDHAAHSRVASIAEFMGKRTYASGLTLTGLDGSITAFIRVILNHPVTTPLRPMIFQHENLRSYYAKMEKQLNLQ
eukprot:TRINITY_DN3177_c0_g1_i2.p1 TRINITY_DN3177_c0_g1~~TRINITY_DN3177_c0_g1_i2.p1  ORF type:complete len:318 (-),score=49.66 TRINITY_DN3177_c0_g1_i2:826-1779(-)